MKKLSLVTTLLAALLHSAVQADMVAVSDGVMHWR